MNERRKSYRALVVEDDKGILGLVKVVLEREDFIVEGVNGGADAIELLKVAAYDLLIIDLKLPQVSGEEVLGFIEETKPKYLRRVIVTTASPRQLSGEFLQRVCHLLEKPFDVSQLVLFARQCREEGDASMAEDVA